MNITELKSELNSILIATCGNSQLRSEMADLIADLREKIKEANKTHIKTFSTKAHMLQFFKDFKEEISGCHEVGKSGEYVLKFTLKA